MKTIWERFEMANEIRYKTKIKRNKIKRKNKREKEKLHSGNKTSGNPNFANPKKKRRKGKTDITNGKETSRIRRIRSIKI